MSNKPKIYANCKAGCLWETVHKDDFDASATWITQAADENSVYNLAPVKNYKIVSPVVSNAYSCVVSLSYTDGTAKTHTFTISEYDAYRDYFYFEILSLTATATALTVVYEVNGNRYSETVSGTAISTTDAKLKITGATAVYGFNADASITGLKGDDGDDGTTFTPSVSSEGVISWTNDGGKANPPSVNIKGATGAKIVSTELQGQDANGGNIYKQTFDNGTTATFTAPKGAKGDSGGSEYANTSEVVDANFTLTSSSTLTDLASQILANKTKVVRVQAGNASRTQVERILGTPPSYDPPTSLSSYLFKVINVPLETSDSSAYSGLIEVYFYYSANYLATCQISFTSGSAAQSNWFDTQKISANAASYSAPSSPVTSFTPSAVWNNSLNPSQVAVPIIGISSGITVSYQGTTYGTDVIGLIFYFHPNGSYDDDPTNLAFDLVVIGKSSCNFVGNLTPVGFSAGSSTGGFTYHIFTIA